MQADTLRTARRSLLLASVLAASWAAALALTGGFVVDAGPVRFSSRDPLPSIIVSLILALAAGALLFLPASRASAQDDLAWYARGFRGEGFRGRPRRQLLFVTGLVAVLSLFDVVQWSAGVPLWVDEEMIAINIRDRSFLELPGTLWLGQSAPLAWLYVQRAVLLVGGSGELALRAVPLVFGIATVWAAAWIGSRWMTAGVAALFIVTIWVGESLSHFRFELKHYSADAFWALLLPAVAAWVVEGDQASQTRRFILWWCVAATAQLFSNGGLLVTPGCVLVLGAVLLRRHGLRAVTVFAATGSVWVAAFVVNYVLSLRFTHHNRYLRNYWITEVPPDTLSFPGTVEWIAGRLGPLAENPAGSTLGAALWIAAAAGFAVSRHRVLSAVFVTAPLAAFVLTTFRFVPLYQRFSLWIVPALYVGVALLCDEGWRAARRAWASRRFSRVLPGAVAVGFAMVIALDIFRAGWFALDLDAPRDSNHAVDDRRAVPWLTARRQPGDAILTTRLGWPAIWWYGGISLESFGGSGRLADGSVMYQLSHQRPGACADWTPLLAAHRRVLVHVGFPDMPDGFYELVLKELLPLASIVDAQRFADRSQVAVLERRSEPAGVVRLPPEADPLVDLDGCIGVGIARRW